MLAIKPFLERVRKPKHNVSLTRQIAATAVIILVGFALGVLQKQKGVKRNILLNIVGKKEIQKKVVSMMGGLQ